MVRRIESDPIDRDERLGEAIEAFLALVEQGQAPSPEAFAERYPDLGADLREALEGLALVQGLVGDPSGPGHGLESGRRIAGYRIVRELGRGGMGIVYEAVHVGLDRPVALKVLGSHAAPDSRGRRRFLNEARTAAGLHHTHIVPVFDVGQVGGLCYYAMQRIEGIGLDRVLRQLRRDRSVAAGSHAGSSLGTGTGSASGNRKSGRGPSSGSTSWLGRTLRRNRKSGHDHSNGNGNGHGHRHGKALGGLDTTQTLQPAGSGSLPPVPGLIPGPGLVDETSSWYSRGDGRILGGGRPEVEPDDPPPFEPPRGSAYYRWVAEIGRQAAEALMHAHQRGIVHRDVKPSNLLVDARGIVWVADFGLARRLADPSQTQHDSLLGTPRYMSPEQARIGPIDGRSDIYSLGATLYELVTLRPPFDGRSAAELVDQIKDQEPATPRQFDPRLPRDLETILLKALAKRPADRYASAQELADDLSRFLNHEPVQARRISPFGRLWRFARRHPSLTIVTTTAAATVLAVATGSYVRILQKHAQLQKAWDDKSQAMIKMESANQATRAAMRELLWRQASMVGSSNLPNRRARGLNLLKEAVALGPDAEMTGKLRAEAVDLLMLRDIEARPGFENHGATRGLAFSADGTRLAMLQDNGEELTLWDVDHRRLLARPRLRPNATVTSDGLASGNTPGLGPGSGFGNRRSNSLVAVGQVLATILPSGGGLRLFDAVTGEFVRDLRTPDRPIRGLFAASAGHRVVTIEQIHSQPQSPSDGDLGPGPGPRNRPDRGSQGSLVINLWDPARWAPTGVGEPLATLGVLEDRSLGRSFPLVSISPDGSIVATALERTSTVALWSADDGRSLGDLDTAGEVTATALGPDGLLAASAGSTIQLWNINSRTRLGQITPNQTFIRLLRFNPHGTLLAAAGVGSDLELWDPAAHKMVALLSVPENDRIDGGPPRRVEDLAFSPDGKTLVATSHGATTPAWGVVDPLAETQLAGFEGRPTSLAFRDDALLAIGTSRGAVWYWQTGRCPGTLEQVRPGEPGELPGSSAGAVASATAPVAGGSPLALREKPTALGFDDRGHLLVCDPEVLQCWDDFPNGDSNIPIALPEPMGSGFPFWRMWAPPMARVQNGQTLLLVRQGQVMAWQSSRPDQVRPLALPPLSLAGGEFDRNRARDHERDRFRNRDNRDRDRPRPFGTAWMALSASQDGKRLYLRDQNNHVRALSIEGDRLRWLDWSLPIQAMTMALSPDGKTLALNDRDHPGTVALIDTARGVETGRLHAQAGGEADGLISSLAFAPDNRTLAVGNQQGVIDLWTLDHPSAPRTRLSGHRGIVNILAFDPRGRHLASGGNDRTVVVWDLAAIGEELGRLGLAW